MSAPVYPKPADGDRDRGGAVIAIYWSIAAVAMLIVGLRFYARRLVRATGADDWLMLISLVSFPPQSYNRFLFLLMRFNRYSK